MFTGIIESVGKVVEVETIGTNKQLTIESNIANELKVDQSVAHNGVCLTVIEVSGDRYKLDAVKETLDKTNIGDLRCNSEVNIERCMQMNGRLDGHIVQGHVDETAKVLSIVDCEGSWRFKFLLMNDSSLIVEKGSVCINGVSLTAFNVMANEFEVAIIPYTFDNTSFNKLKVGETVNLEYDIIGKYVKKLFKS